MIDVNTVINTPELPKPVPAAQPVAQSAMPVIPRPPLNADQEAVITAILAWLKDPDEPFFVVRGYAGTGKTFAIRNLVDRVRGRFIFTAPTNKATKVLKDTMTSPEFKPETRTIYSLLGLRLEANGELKELAVPEDPIDLSQYVAVIVDEGSMVNKVLLTHIEMTAKQFGVKFIFMGDPAQLPPVKETGSGIWALRPEALLEKVMRHDNQILTLATRIRSVVNHPAPTIKLESDNDGDQGVWKLDERKFREVILRAVDDGQFTKINYAKAIAWRNVTVDSLNRFIRGRLWDNAAQHTWVEGERVIFTAPAKDLQDEPMASTDDEGVVMNVATAEHPLYAGFDCWRVSIMLDDNRPAVAWVVHPNSAPTLAKELAEIAASAKSNPRRWKAYWEMKDAFHSLRYAYAITAHRSQGSTYNTVFVDYKDILINQNRNEAMRCLYVACTRPSKRLFLA